MDGSTVEARGPFGPEFDGITYQKTIGWSNYNAMEITLKHHSRMGEILGAYTYAKSLDNSSSLSEEVNPIESGVNKAISAFDVRHNFVFSYMAPLPLEKVLPGPADSDPGLDAVRNHPIDHWNASHAFQQRRHIADRFHAERHQ